MFDINFTVVFDEIQYAGSYFDVTNQKFSIALFSYDYPIYAAIAIIDIDQTATTFPLTFDIFYSAQNGFQINFQSAFFKNLYQAVLAGSISGGTSQYQYGGLSAVLIDIPEPYYFSMGDPVTKICTIIGSTNYTFIQNVSGVIQASTTLIQYTFAASPYYEKVPVNIPNIPQVADITTLRKLTLPTGILPLYNYTLGDIATVVQFGECSYDQPCSEFSMTYSVIQQNGSAIPSEAMIFSSSARKLIVSSLNLAMQGTYNLKFRCIIPDGFMAYKNFTVNILYDGSDLGQQNTTNTTTTNTTTTNTTTTNDTTSINTTTTYDTTTNTTTNNTSANPTNTITTNTTTSNTTTTNTTTTNTTTTINDTTNMDNTSQINGTTTTNGTTATNTTTLNNTQNSTVNPNQSNSNTNITNSTVIVSPKKYQPNYAPEFLENLINKWTIRAGSEATFTLPEFYDLNPSDKVSVTLETAEKHKYFFRIKNNQFIVFSAGFPELGDIDMIISLTDDHQPTPKTTKYRLTQPFTDFLRLSWNIIADYFTQPKLICKSQNKQFCSNLSKDASISL
eukprot:403341452